MAYEPYDYDEALDDLYRDDRDITFGESLRADDDPDEEQALLDDDLAEDNTPSTQAEDGFGESIKTDNEPEEPNTESTAAELESERQAAAEEDHVI